MVEKERKKERTNEEFDVLIVGLGYVVEFPCGGGGCKIVQQLVFLDKH